MSWVFVGTENVVSVDGLAKVRGHQAVVAKVPGILNEI